MSDDLSYPVAALWDIYVLSGADTDGDKGPGALIAGMGYEGFARTVVESVRELRQDYDELQEQDELRSTDADRR